MQLGRLNYTSAASGVAYAQSCGATNLLNWTDVGPKLIHRLRFCAYSDSSLCYRPPGTEPRLTNPKNALAGVAYGIENIFSPLLLVPQLYPRFRRTADGWPRRREIFWSQANLLAAPILVQGMSTLREPLAALQFSADPRPERESHRMIHSTVACSKCSKLSRNGDRFSHLKNREKLAARARFELITLRLAVVRQKPIIRTRTH